MTTRLELSKPQFAFVNALEQFPCFCGGYGSGKTIAAVVRALLLKCRHPRIDLGYYMPTYDLVKRVGYPTFEEVLGWMGIRGRLNKSEHEMYIQGAGKIIFRSMEDPTRLVGYKHGDAIADELDILKPRDAVAVWNKIVARNRALKPDNSPNTIGVATTPEGFKFVYERWRKEKIEGHRLIKASTRSNARHLPVGYIETLLRTYPAQIVSAYVDGEFVNMVSGSVYPSFDREMNDTKVEIQPKEALHVGMDFNVTKMAAAIHVLRDGEPHAVAELVNVFDTPAMIGLLQARYKDKQHPIMVYPDASGRNRRSANASESDLSLLRGAGFTVCVNARNPAVKDRVLSVNSMIEAEGKRRYRVSQDRCPHLVESLEKQAYDDNGEPDKSAGLDHIVDGAGYFIVYRWPIEKPVTLIKIGRAH